MPWWWTSSNRWSSCRRQSKDRGISEKLRGSWTVVPSPDGGRKHSALEERPKIHPLALMEEREGINTRDWEAVTEKPKKTQLKGKGTNKRKELFSKPDIPTRLNITTQHHFIVLQTNEATPSALKQQPEITGAA